MKPSLFDLVITRGSAPPKPPPKPESIRSHEARKMRRRKVLLETGVLLPWPCQKTKRRKDKSVRVKDEEWAGVKMTDDGIDV